MRKKSSCTQIIPVYLIVLLFTLTSVQAKESIIYGGGPFYSNAAEHLDTIRNSGFTTVMLWTIHVHSDGDLVYNEPKLVDNGVYVGDPDWPAQVHAFKEGQTSVRRIEIAIGAWGSGAFENIKNLIAAEGTGPDSTLYKNFKVLKDTIPAIDGISYDDEVTYDVDSSVAFAVMLYDLGFKVTLCPYTRSSYWSDVFSQTNAQRPGAIDRIDLQCYAGGAYNSPGTWNNYFGGLHVTPGLWCYSNGQNPSGVQSQMTSWNNSYNIAGGFMWLFDDMLNYQNTYPVADYAAAINNALSIDITEQTVVTLYQHCPLYDGWSAEMGIGAYTTADIIAAGGKDNDASSLAICPGFKVTLFDADNFEGNSIVLRQDVDCLVDAGWNDILSSMIIEPISEPVGYWKLNEGSGDVIADHGDLGFDGTIYNMQEDGWTKGKQCGGLNFDGNDDYVEINNFKGISGKSSRTCMAWIKTSTSQPSVITAWGNELNGEKWMFRINSDGTFGVGIWGGSINSETTVNDGQWHHVAVVLNNSGNPSVKDIIFYHNGKQVNSFSNNNASINTSMLSNATLGAFSWQGSMWHLFNGVIDEIKVYSRALNADEILQVFNEYALNGDFSSNGQIDLDDFSVLAFNWQNDDVCDIDLTCDCSINIDDLTVLVDQWLQNTTN